MSEFTASNGVKITVSRKDDTYLLGQSLYASNPGSYTEATASAEGISALREFFQHERDRELGRWRDPENPDRYVRHGSVGPRAGRGERRWLTIVDEVTGETHCLAEDYDLAGMGDLWETAKRYFAAHPESKPWHDARAGEVWAVKTKHNDQERPVFVNSDGDFENAEEYFHSEFREITAGRRIWPEGDRE